ncbi:MAG: hypothetical protein UR28_C0004G0011 [Candidatus Peregrinibacteria bacterium GW2011_GWF2_33_10]|nr:MAG: hypothetical protein UR28_C0004G0011 [Candidatus Peregrinibacteria bacterium GW2011_GWF2_33_10]OGJ44126.1 MAG: hypothetical protein A2263_01750 [Candidatus Peregrinibacteria bacterium RIFOXYA2_FULL_33_21]OGJ46443.1 MAG: hypothetical protein A2272_06755 [Candidatus Peregrinibacteria bacterium RIFOXYA12_FULL_33_12]
MNIEIKKPNSHKKYLIIGTLITLTLIITSYFGSNNLFKGDLNYIAGNLGKPDLKINSIYLDQTTNKLTIIQSNDGTVDNNINSILKVKSNNATPEVNLINLNDGYTYIYIYNNSDGSIYRKIVYKWSDYKNYDFLEPNGESEIELLKLDSNKYTVHACIDPADIITNEEDEPGIFDCEQGIESNNYMSVNLDQAFSAISINRISLTSMQLKENADQKIFRFSATPDVNLNINLSKFTLNIESSENILLKNVTLYKTDTDGELNEEKDFTLSGDANNDGYFSNGERINFDYGENISEIHNDTNFIVRADIEITDLKIKDKPYLKISMLGDNENIDMTSYETISQGNYNFIWNDAENGWNNGFGIPGIPTGVQVFLK